MEDEALMTQFLEGDGCAFGALDGRVRPRLRRFFERYGLDGEELAQHTLFQVVTRAHQYRREEPVRAWIFGIARNVAFDSLRSASRRRAHAVKAASTEPVTDLVCVEQRADLTRLLRRLEPPTLELLWRHHVEGRTFSELAHDCGAPSSTLKVRAHRAYRALRQASTPAR
ncbi:MAG: sigma-70 family RNA polymerase sigma factor [Archangium sp.]|nr:sigma-70 family RNA polymerase sigma factor [Archangium sp.]